MGLIDFTEPFSSLINQGMVILDGAKMSKSKGNLVELSDLLGRYGADALRLGLAFAGPVEDDKEWNGVSISGAHKFLARVLRVGDETSSPVGADATAGDAALRRITHRLLADAPGLLEQTKFNVLVARLMELVNGIRKTIDGGVGAGDSAVREAAETVALMLEPIAPHTAEELWERLGHEPSVSAAPWPDADPALLVQDTVTTAVQVGGKVRATIDVPADISDADLEAAARADEKVQRALEGKEIVRVIVRAPKIVNFAVRG
jgi:leucyl-tRNA synthetase